jgi:predicted MFS family arabinose efflux permease
LGLGGDLGSLLLLFGVTAATVLQLGRIRNRPKLIYVGFLAGPIAARKIGLISTVVMTELLSIPFFLVLALTQSLSAAVFAFWMRGALMNMNHPLQTNFAMEVVSADQQAVTNSLRMLVWNLSWMISTQVGGWIIERRGFTLPMLTTIALYLIASVVTYAFWRDRRALGRA